MLHRTSLLVLVTALAGLALSTGCPPPATGGEGEGEGAAGEGEGEGEGGVAGDTCANPIAISDGVATTGDTTGAGDDLAPSCVFSTPATANDLVYSITLTEEKSITAALTTDADLAVAIYNAATCGAADELACADNSTADETTTLSVAPPGTYFIVVDGNDDGTTVSNGPFTLTVTLGDPVCTGDGLDGDGSAGNPGDNDAEHATFLGGANLDTTQIDADPSTTAIDPLDIHLCPGDVDYYLVTHLGGPFHADGTARSGETATLAFDVRPATVDPVATLAAGGAPVVTAEGTAVDLGTAATDLAAGYYLLRASETGAAIDNALDYDFSFSQDCEADNGDSPIAALDDVALADTVGAVNVIADDIAAGAATALPLSICDGDADVLVVEPLGPGTVTLVITGAGLTVAVAQAAVPVADQVTPPVETAAVFTDTTAGDAHTVAITGVDDQHHYIVHITEATPSTTTNAYTVSATFAYDPPADDTCDTASALTVADTTTDFTNNTAGAHSELDGLCNGDNSGDPANPTPANLKGGDVFYALTLAATSNIELSLTSTTFNGTVTVYQAPAAQCPSDLSTLVPLDITGGAFAAATDPSYRLACRSGNVSVHGAPAGDYLIAVDGNAGFDTGFFGIIPPSRGGFTLTTQSFATAPVTQACVSPGAITQPASGASTTAAVNFADLSTADEIHATCGGNGQERAFTFTATADATLTISTDNANFDTVLSVRQDGCDDFTGTELGSGATAACNDDNGDGGLNSSVTATVTSGTTYFIIVDTFSLVATASDTQPETTLTITAP